MNESTNPAISPSSSLQTAVGEDVVYSPNDLTAQLRQGEIISDVIQYIYNPVSGRVKSLEHHFVIVASQDCDLERDFDALRQKNDSSFNGVLLYEAYSINRAKEDLDTKSLKEAYKNNHDRYGYLEQCGAKDDLAGEGFGSLIIDFRRHFTMESSEIYRQLDLLHGPRRRSRLQSPYSEHFQDRLANYLQRVALPRNHRKPATEAA